MYTAYPTVGQATVKATRRDLRRAMGVSGVSALAEAQENIARLANSLTLAHSQLDIQRSDIAQLRQEHDDLIARLAAKAKADAEQPDRWAQMWAYLGRAVR